MKFIKDKEMGIWQLVGTDKNVLAQIVPWMTGGYAVFMYGQLTVVQRNLAKAKKFAKACA